MTADEAAGGGEWLPLPDVAERLGMRLRDVRNLLRDRALAAVRPDEDGPLLIPSVFLFTAADGAAEPGPVPSLRGTLIQLADGGMSIEESVEWLTTEQEELGTTPIAALRARRIHEVRRLAQTVAI